MANYKNFYESTSVVKIEVEGTGGTSNSYVGEMTNALQNIANSLISQVRQMPEDQKPTELTVSFGLKALADGGFAITLTDANANFKVSMKWGSESGGLIGDSLPMGPLP